MQLQRAIKKIEKWTGRKVQLSDRQYYVECNGHYIEFYTNGQNSDDVHHFHVRRTNDESRPEVDYFAGWGTESLESALRYVKPKTGEELGVETGDLVRVKKPTGSRGRGTNYNRRVFGGRIATIQSIVSGHLYLMFTDGKNPHIQLSGGRTIHNIYFDLKDVEKL